MRKKNFKTMETKVHGFATRAEQIYDVRKRIMRDSLYLETRRSSAPETPAEWLENRYREKDPSNNYESMQ